MNVKKAFSQEFVYTFMNFIKFLFLSLDMLNINWKRIKLYMAIPSVQDLLEPIYAIHTVPMCVCLSHFIDFIYRNSMWPVL